MKTLIASLLVSSTLLVPASAAAASRYSDRFADGWPKWIGRSQSVAKHICADGTPCRMHKVRPEMAAKYLPLYLVKTGGLAEMLDEVEGTPNVDTTGWPSWIGDFAR